MTPPINTPTLRDVGDAAPGGGARADGPAMPQGGGNAHVMPLDVQFDELDTCYDDHERVFWNYMKSRSRPSYTMGMLSDIRRAMNVVKGMFRDYDGQGEQPVNYVVFASRMPGIFNLGGDLPLFVDLIRAGDAEGLRAYAHACVDLVYSRYTKLGLPCLSISLVQGDALGGGFEATLADDIVIAERRAKFGLPEIMFNLFPGMGAYTFLSRRLDQARAERMILSGRIYSAEEMYEMGLVDELAEDGTGEDALYDFIERNRRTFKTRLAVYEARRRTQPVSREELISITDTWVETAIALDPADLRRMERLANAQDRRRMR